MIYSEKKVAQMAAYFLQKRGGRMAYIKLMKLLYLADRESLNRYGEPITFDRMASLPNGPVLSRTLDLLNGQAVADCWDNWVQGEANYEISLRREHSTRDELDELSDADLEVMDSVWNQFGGMKRWELVEWTHQHCPEWQDPNGSSYPIAPKAVFEALGRSPDEAQAQSRHLMERKQLGQIISTLQ
jgi:uncharacterized phage-associated protein